MSRDKGPAMGSLLPQLFQGGMGSGWAAGSRALTRSLLAEVRLPAGPLVEIGCGGGDSLSMLQADRPGHPVIGIDRHPVALGEAATLRLPLRLAQADAHALPLATGRVAALLALDVLDQSSVEQEAILAEAHRVLAADGLLLVRVSAHQWLYGPHDVAFGTGHRLAKAELRQALEQASFRIERFTYVDSLAAPAAVGLRLAQRWGIVAWRPSLYADRSLNRWLAQVLQSEAKLVRYANLPWGLSLVVLARKDAR